VAATVAAEMWLTSLVRHNLRVGGRVALLTTGICRVHKRSVHKPWVGRVLRPMQHHQVAVVPPSQRHQHQCRRHAKALVAMLALASWPCLSVALLVPLVCL